MLDFLDFHPCIDSAAVRLAMAETHMIQQTQEYLTKEGVNIDAFTSYARTGGKTIARSNNIIMVCLN